jgi:hypothetical protein
MSGFSQNCIRKSDDLELLMFLNSFLKNFTVMNNFLWDF